MEPTHKRPRDNSLADGNIHAAERVISKKQRKRPASGFYGVGSKGKKWKANIGYGGRTHHLGYFSTAQEAALAYDKEARQCGEDRPTNYDSIQAAEAAAAQAKVAYASAPHLCAPPQVKPKPRQKKSSSKIILKKPGSGFYGVKANWTKTGWLANVEYSGKEHFLGIFDTKQQAALAYDREARQCGEEKPLNYESIEQAEEAAVLAEAEYALSQSEVCTSQDLRARPGSGFFGVYDEGKRWQAQITSSDKTHWLGTFDTKEEAALAYDREARQCEGGAEGEEKPPLNYERMEQAEEAAALAQMDKVATQAEGGLNRQQYVRYPNDLHAADDIADNSGLVRQTSYYEGHTKPYTLSDLYAPATEPLTEPIDDSIPVAAPALDNVITALVPAISPLSDPLSGPIVSAETTSLLAVGSVDVDGVDALDDVAALSDSQAAGGLGLM
jgi:hypothetical protein